MSERFTEHLRTRIDRYGPLCVGIDPSSALLARCGLPDTAAGALDLARRVLDAAAGEVAVVKPQAAYFERFGAAGLQAIEQLLALARAQDTPVIYDAKRGDIDATATAYGEAFFRSEAPLRCDALTVHAYLGYGALAGLVKLAAEAAGGVFVVVRSSNPQGQALQLARLGDGRTVAECLADEISADNAHWLAGGSGCGPVGAVVGATCDDAAAIVDRLPHSYILAPGVGAQGASCADIARRMPNARGRVLANVSRGIFAGGTQPEQLRQTLQQLRDEASVLV
ncbi:MAG: orotidine-5'-phosphate decarboxylase [Xanthomonadales bacterium]|nr:orotidine-5'-phosphate decarboxylase [Xanthomonadales bacterium]